MSTSLQDTIREYYSARRKHAMKRARGVKRSLEIVELMALDGPELGVLEEEVTRLRNEVEVWVEEARRCNRAMVLSRIEHEMERRTLLGVVA